MSKFRAAKNSQQKKKTQPDHARPDEGRDDQIITLLNTLGERLIRSEKERQQSNALLRKTTQQVEDLENWSDQSERAFLTIHDRMNKREMATKALEERMDIFMIEQEPVLKKIEKAVSLSDKIEAALKQQAQITDRLEQFTQDRSRIARKLERIEESLLETREAISGKSTLLLSNPIDDGSDAGDTGSASTASATNKQKALPQKQAKKAANDDKWWKPGMPSQATAFVCIMIIALGAGWYANDYKDGQLIPGDILALATGNTAQAPQQTPQAEQTAYLDEKASDDALVEIAAVDQTDAQMMNNIGKALDETIEPTAGNATRATVEFIPPESEPQPTQKTDAETASAEKDTPFDADAFIATQQQDTPLRERITADPNLPDMIKDIEAQAFQGDKTAQHDLAVVYSAGHGGVNVDFEKSFQWFREAALQDMPNARYNLGVLYHQGLGTVQNTERAIQWYKAAAALDHPDALYNLGIANIEGIGMPYSPEKAARYFERAAAKGIMEASYNLGLIYENGLLGKTDTDQAIYWYKISSDQNSKEAKNALTQLKNKAGYSDDDIDRIVKKFRTAQAQSPNTPDNTMSANTQQTTKSTKAAPKEVNVISGGLTRDDMIDPQAVRTNTAATSAISSQNASPQDNSILIAQIQEQLMEMGFYPGPANGLFDPKTEDAVISYQARFGLTPDGRFTEALLTHMMANDLAGNETRFDQGSRF